MTARFERFDSMAGSTPLRVSRARPRGFFFHGLVSEAQNEPNRWSFECLKAIVKLSLCLHFDWSRRTVRVKHQMKQLLLGVRCLNQF